MTSRNASSRRSAGSSTHNDQGGDRYENRSDSPGQGRVEYAAAGAAMRQAFARAHETRATARELQMLTLIVEYTGTWSKLADRIAMSVFERRLGWHHRDAEKVRGSLVEKRIIDYTPSRGRVAGLYALPPAQPPDVAPEVEPPDVEPEVCSAANLRTFGLSTSGRRAGLPRR